jgi:hypothetical protein
MTSVSKCTKQSVLLKETTVELKPLIPRVCGVARRRPSLGGGCARLHGVLVILVLLWGQWCEREGCVSERPGSRAASGSSSVRSPDSGLGNEGTRDLLQYCTVLLHAIHVRAQGPPQVRGQPRIKTPIKGGKKKNPELIRTPPLVPGGRSPPPSPSPPSHPPLHRHPTQRCPPMHNSFPPF